jgi:hypothetical protein
MLYWNRGNDKEKLFDGCVCVEVGERVTLCIEHNAASDEINLLHCV